MRNTRSTNVVNIDKAVPVKRAKIGTQTQDCLDARQLYEFLQGGPDEHWNFSRWIKARIEEYEFEEDHDFTFAAAEGTGGNPAVEYTITINMAKELAMLEKTELGRSVRKYFIACEQELKKLKGDLSLFSTLKKQLSSAITTAKSLGYTDGDEVEHAFNAIRQENGIDAGAFFPEAAHKLRIKKYTLSISRIARLIDCRPDQVKEVLVDKGIIRKDFSGEQVRWVPSKNPHAWEYIAFYDESTGRLLFTAETSLMVEVCVKRHPRLWDMKTAQIRDDGTVDRDAVLRRSKAHKYLTNLAA